jgi:hypothetical protein
LGDQILRFFDLRSSKHVGTCHVPPVGSKSTARQTAAQATLTLAALSANLNWVARSITITLCAGATPSGIQQFVLRDGLTGAGAIIWQCDLQNVASGSAQIVVLCNIAGSPGTAMTWQVTRNKLLA